MEVGPNLGTKLEIHSTILHSASMKKFKFYAKYYEKKLSGITKIVEKDSRTEGLKEVSNY